MVYFHINLYQRHDKNASCVANRSNLIKVHLRCSSLQVYTIQGFCKIFLEKAVFENLENLEKIDFAFFLKLYLNFFNFSGMFYSYENC